MRHLPLASCDYPFPPASFREAGERRSVLMAHTPTIGPRASEANAKRPKSERDEIAREVTELLGDDIDGAQVMMDDLE